MSGKIDAAVTDGVFIDYYAIHTPKTFRVLNDHVPERGFAVGVDPANKELLTQINKALSDMEADGTAQAIYKKWFFREKMNKCHGARCMIKELSHEACGF